MCIRDRPPSLAPRAGAVPSADVAPPVVAQGGPRPSRTRTGAWRSAGPPADEQARAAPAPPLRPAPTDRPPPGPALAGSPHATRRSPQLAAPPGCRASTTGARAPRRTSPPTPPPPTPEPRRQPRGTDDDPPGTPPRPPCLQFLPTCPSPPRYVRVATAAATPRATPATTSEG